MAQSPEHAGRSAAISAGDTASRRPRSESAFKWWIIAWALLLVAATSIVWIKCPAWLTAGESGSTTIRNVGLVILAAVGLPLAIWRSVIAERQAQAAQRQSEIAEQNLLNDRFQKGVEMLGHPDIGSVRIGGVHTLARLAGQYPDIFHLRVMQTLAAFVVDRTRVDEEEAQPGAKEARDYSGYSPPEVRLAADQKVGPVPDLAKDVEAAMRSIAERSEGQIALEHGATFQMNLADTSIPGFIFHEADFSGFDLTKADMRRARGWDACLADARLAGADLSAANMRGANFRDADMRRVNLTATRLCGADLRNADLGQVDIASENLWKGARFSSKLVGTDLHGADLRNAQLAGADMRGASLAVARLDRADLRDANLSGADLRGANLSKAQLGNVDLTDANLGGTGADLSGADLTGANLTGANLGRANLSGTNLAGANLTGADFSRDCLSGDPSPAMGLTQRQLDQARADPNDPPILDGTLDSETDEPLLWRSQPTEWVG